MDKKEYVSRVKWKYYNSMSKMELAEIIAESDYNKIEEDY